MFIASSPMSVWRPCLDIRHFGSVCSLKYPSKSSAVTRKGLTCSVPATAACEKRSRSFQSHASDHEAVIQGDGGEGSEAEAAPDSVSNSSAALNTASRRRPIRAADGTLHYPLRQLRPRTGSHPYTILQQARKRQKDDCKRDIQAAGSAAVWAATSGSIADIGRTRKDTRTVPGARHGVCAEVQLARQFRDLMKHPIPGISAAPSEDDMLVWNVQLAGPEGSPYAGGWFNVRLKFGDNFPGQPPEISFLTPIWHPNISDDTKGGRVCVSIGEYYQGVSTVACVLAGLQMLLSTPNPRSPMNHVAAAEMLEDISAFNRKAAGLTRMCAM